MFFIGPHTAHNFMSDLKLAPFSSLSPFNSNRIFSVNFNGISDLNEFSYFQTFQLNKMLAFNFENFKF